MTLGRARALVVPSVLSLASLASLAGCPDSQSSAKDKKVTPSPSLPPPTASAAGKGMYTPGLDPKVLEPLRRVLACKWDANGPSEWCDDARAWKEARDVFDGGRADASLATLLEDADDRVRLLAAQNLAVFGRSYRADRTLAERIVRAAEAERSPRVAAYLGATVAKIDVDKTELFDRIRAVASKHALVALRVALVTALAQQNPSSTSAFTLTLDLVRDPEREVRAAALAALWTVGSRHPEETCRAWREHIDDVNDEDVAASSSDYLTWAGSCQSYFDALLDSQERRFKAGRTSKPLFTKSLGNLCEDVKATTTQRARANELLHRMVEQKTTDRFVRGAALADVIRCDPAAGKAFVQKYAADEDSFVKDRATDLLKPR